MRDLIEALQIFMKYCGDVKYPTYCNQEEFIVCVRPSLVSPEDQQRLKEIGFVPYEDFGYEDYAFVSYRYGSK